MRLEEGTLLDTARELGPFLLHHPPSLEGAQRSLNMPELISSTGFSTTQIILCVPHLLRGSLASVRQAPEQRHLLQREMGRPGLKGRVLGWSQLSLWRSRVG